MEITCRRGTLTGVAKLKQLLPQNYFKLVQKHTQNQKLSLPVLIFKTSTATVSHKGGKKVLVLFNLETGILPWTWTVD